MKLFVALLALVSCCLAAKLPSTIIPAVPFEQSLPNYADFADFASDEAAARIISGHQAAANQFPYQVALRITTGTGAGICGGSIITPSWVLSAAHCTTGGSQFTMRFGANTRSSGGIAQTSMRAINHPQYNPANLNNDVSLVPVPSPLPFGPAIQAVRLPTQAQAGVTFAGERVTVSGWGAVTNGGPAQELLRWTDVQVIPNLQCQNTFGGSVVVPHVICTVGYSSNQGVCGGDSGGPLVIREGTAITQIGVVAFGASGLLGGCVGGRPSGYMRTASFLGWINQNTGLGIRS